MCWRFLIFVAKEFLRWMLLGWLLCLTYDPNGDMLIVATLFPFGEILAKLDVGMQRPLDVINNNVVHSLKLRVSNEWHPRAIAIYKRRSQALTLQGVHMWRDQSSSVELSKHGFQMSSTSHRKDACCLIQASVKIGNQGKTSSGSSYSWLIIFLLDSSRREV